MRIRALTLASVAAEVAALRPSEATGREVADIVACAPGRRARPRGRRGGGSHRPLRLARRHARPHWPCPAEDLEAAYREADPGIIAALETSRDNCTFFHRHELVADWEDVGPRGSGSASATCPWSAPASTCRVASVRTPPP